MGWVEWSLGDAASCENCRATFGLTGEEPPCEECAKPTHLMPENETALRLWSMLSGYDRPVIAGAQGDIRLPLRNADAINLCNTYNATLEDFEKVMMIEGVAFPLLTKIWDRERSTHQEAKNAS